MKRKPSPTGRLDIAAVRIVEDLLRVYAPNVRAVVFDGGAREKDLRITAAKLLGPRTRKTRLIRQLAPVVGAALRDGMRAAR
jgi:hypothetical protein